MTHDLQTIETAIKHFCYQNGIDYTGILEVYNGGVWVDSSKINNDQIKMIKGYMKRLQEIGREGVVDPHSLAHIGGGLQNPGSYCDHCGEWIPIGLLSAVRHFEKSERCMVHTISEGLKVQQPIMMGGPMKEKFEEFLKNKKP